LIDLLRGRGLYTCMHRARISQHICPRVRMRYGDMYRYVGVYAYDIGTKEGYTGAWRHGDVGTAQGTEVGRQWHLRSCEW
jgi:hypothetical protein